MRTLASLTELNSTTRQELTKAYQQLMGVSPPKRCKTLWLQQVLSWHLQMQALHQNVDVDTLLSLTQRLFNSASKSDHKNGLKPGDLLIREWKGVSHEVQVSTEGLHYAGQCYGSLSAVARAITGTNWSGPAFFGVKA